MADTAQKWALLIGVDFYFRGTERPIEFPDLNGCVRDILAVEEYLQRVGVRNIAKLTASGADDKPVEDEYILPTRDNIVRELQRIADVSKEGDLVYIHYSGHGIRRDELGASQGGGDNISGTALAPTDVSIGGAYLTGYQLGLLIKYMVETKKLRVTLVLDSCYSGRGMRKSAGYAIRTLPGKFDNSSLPSDKTADSVAKSTFQSGQRHASAGHSWLSHPTGCTVLTACEVDQTAGEDSFGTSGEKNGVLTFWMLDILWRSPVAQPPTYARVKEKVTANINHMRPRLNQTPVLHGDGDYTFFGTELVVARSACHILRICGKYVDLDVGRAQSVAEGAIYDIYPAEGDVVVAQNSSPRQARITEVLDFESTAELLFGDPGETAIAGDSRAVLRSWAFQSGIHIEFHLPECPDREAIRDSLETELERAPTLQMHSDDANYKTWTVSLDCHNNFQVHEDDARLQRLPAISPGEKEWCQNLGQVLRHVARFQDVARLSLEINNLFPPDWFSFEIRSKSRHLNRDASGRYEALAGDRLTVSFSNKGPLESVHVAIFSLNPSWGVHKLHPGPGQNAFKTYRNQPEQFVISMSIPDKANEEDPSDIVDIIRAFVYYGEYPPSWDEIALPDLPGKGSLLSNLRVDVSATEPEPQLGDFRQSTKDTASVRTERWTILDLTVHTSPRE